LASLSSNLPVDASLVVVAVNADKECRALAKKHDAILVEVQACRAIGLASKAALYSIARSTDAQFYLCLDADILAVDSLKPLMDLVELKPEKLHVTLCAPVKDDKPLDPDHAIKWIYGGEQADVALFLSDEARPSYARINAGVFAASREVLLRLDDKIRLMGANAARLMDSPTMLSPDEFIFGCAVAEMGGAHIVGKRWNLLLYHEIAQAIRGPDGQWKFWSGDTLIALLHGAARTGKVRLAQLKEFLRSQAPQTTP